MKIFVRAQSVAVLATTIDFLAYTIFAKLVGLPFGVSAFSGALVGGIVGFYFGRVWAFTATDRCIRRQGIKYLLVCLVSAFLNGFLVEIFTSWLIINFMLARILASIMVGVGFNYPLHKYFVFSKSNI